MDGITHHSSSFLHRNGLAQPTRIRQRWGSCRPDIPCLVPAPFCLSSSAGDVGKENALMFMNIQYMLVRGGPDDTRARVCVWGGGYVLFRLCKYSFPPSPNRKKPFLPLRQRNKQPPPPYNPIFLPVSASYCFVNRLFVFFQFAEQTCFHHFAEHFFFSKNPIA